MHAHTCIYIYISYIVVVKWFREIVSAFQRQTILGDIILVAKAEDDVAMLTFHFEFFNKMFPC